MITNTVHRNNLIKEHFHIIDELLEEEYKDKPNKDELRSIGVIALLESIDRLPKNKDFGKSASRYISNKINCYLNEENKYQEFLSLNDQINEIDRNEMVTNYEYQDTLRIVLEEIGKMNNNEQQILMNYLEIGDDDTKTVTALSESLGMSTYFHDKHLKNALRKLQKALLEREITGIFSNGKKEQNLNDKAILWYKKYCAVQAYKQYYGDMNIPIEFKSINGVDYDEDGFNLYSWLLFQRKKKLMYDNQVELLNELEKEKKFRSVRRKLYFKKHYGFLDEESEKIIDRLPLQALIAKTNYLIDNDMTIVKEGKLHEIYAMNSKDMQKKYNVDLKELIHKYCYDKKALVKTIYK